MKDQNDLPILEVDEYMRPETTMQSLGALEPSFEKMGDHGFDDVAILKYPELETIKHVHHAGNSSGIVDGAAGVLIGNEKMADKYELKATAKIRSFASIGSEPTIMLTGPADSAEKALKKNPEVFTVCRSSNFLIFEVACFLKAHSASSRSIPFQSSLSNNSASKLACLASLMPRFSRRVCNIASSSEVIIPTNLLLLSTPQADPKL